MAIANLQAQMANLTSQLSHYIDQTTMQGAPTFDTQGYQVNQRGWEDVNTWGYQGYDQPSNNLCSNVYNSNWRDYSNSMRWEPQPVQHEAYWQPYEEFYSQQQPPRPYAQPNSGSTIDCNQILDELISLFQGSQNQTKEAPQGEYWQPYEEFYTTPMQPPQSPPQQFQSNSSTSMDNDQILDVLTSLMQELQNQDKRVDKLKNQMGEIVEFIAQIQEQRAFSNSNIVNPIGEFEIAEAITLGSAMEVGAEPRASKQSQEEDEQLLIEEEEEDTPTARVEQPLPQALKVPMPSNLGKVVPNSIHSNIIPPNVPFPRRFMISKEEESTKDIVEAFPKVQVAGEYVECIKEDILGTTIPKEVGFYDTGQVINLKALNMAKFSNPTTLKEGVFVLKFLSEHTGKPPPRISILFYTNMLLMIQAPTLEFKPLPDHFKYHLPFKDQFHTVGPRGV